MHELISYPDHPFLIGGGSGNETIHEYELCTYPKPKAGNLIPLLSIKDHSCQLIEV